MADEALTVHLPARLGLAEARACVESVRAAWAALGPSAGPGGAPREAVVMASGLQSFDSAALATLLALRRSALAAGWGFRVQGLPADLAGLSRLYGVDGLLPS